MGLIFRLGAVARSTQLALTAGLLAMAWWLFGGACPPGLLTALQTGSVVLLALGGRLPQVRRWLCVFVCVCVCVRAPVRERFVGKGL